MLLRASKRISPTMRHAYGVPVISFTRQSFVVGICTVVVVFFAGLLNLIPGQPPPKRIQLPVDRLRDHVHQNPKYAGKPGLIAYVPIDKTNFPKGIPIRLCLQVSLGEDLTNEWQLTGTYGLLGKPLRPSQKRPATYLDYKGRVDIQDVEVVDLDPNGPYVLQIPLAGRTKKANANVARKLIMDERQMTVTHIEAFCEGGVDGDTRDYHPDVQDRERLQPVRLRPFAFLIVFPFGGLFRRPGLDMPASPVPTGGCLTKE